ncbi:MAG: hypothetical protein ABUK01_07380 [Leptospirales bacterium]
MWKNTDFHTKFDVTELYEVKEESKKKPRRVKSKPVSKKTVVSPPKKKEVKKVVEAKPAIKKQPAAEIKEALSSSVSPELMQPVEFVEIPEMVLDEAGKSEEEYKP